MIPGVCAMPAASSASSGMFGRLAVAFGIHISVRHAAIFPSSPSAPSSDQQLRRCLRIPAVLVLARPLDAHRPADRLRQQRRVGGRVVVAVHPVAARAVEIDDAHRVLGHRERARDRLAEAVRGLRRRPDRRLAVADVGHGARRSQRRVRLHRPVEFGAEIFFAAGERRLRVAFFHQRLVGVERDRRASTPARPRRRSAGPNPTSAPSAAARRRRRPIRSRRRRRGNR